MKGSVSKRCQCAPIYSVKGERLACKQKHGSWSYVADGGRDPQTGKRRQVKRSGFVTKAEAEAALAELIDLTSKGITAHDERQTVATYLNSWLALKIANGLRPTTARSYRQHLDDYLIPELGHIRLRDLRGSHVEAMLVAVQQPKGKGKTPKAATARRVHATLRSALTTAKRRRLITFNAAQDVELPAAPRPKVRPWEPEDLGAFLDQIAADRLGAYLELSAATG